MSFVWGGGYWWTQFTMELLLPAFLAFSLFAL